MFYEMASSVPSPQGPHVKDFNESFTKNSTLTSIGGGGLKGKGTQFNLISNNESRARMNNGQSVTHVNNNYVNQNQEPELQTRIRTLFSDYINFNSHPCKCQPWESTDTCQRCTRVQPFEHLLNGLPQASFNALNAVFAAFNEVILPILRESENDLSYITNFLTVMLTLPDELVWAPSGKSNPHVELYQDFMIKLMDHIGSGVSKPIIERAVLQLALIKNCSTNTKGAAFSPSNSNKNQNFGTMSQVQNAQTPSATIQSKSELNARYSNSLRLLRAVVTKMPQCKNLVGSCLLARFSIETMSIDQCIAYLKNLFRISTFSSQLQEMILSFVVERLMNLDSKLRLDSEAVTRLNQLSYGSPESVSPSPHDSQLSSYHSRAVKLQIEQYILNANSKHEVSEQERLIYHAEKLDSCMKIVFDYLQRCSHLDNRNELMSSLFGNFINIFSNSILRTYELNSTQFIMFYICSFKKEFGSIFINFLFQRIFDEGLYPEARRVSIAYAGSFLARAKFLEESVVLSALEKLIQYMQAYTEKFSISEIDIERHSVFYNIAQCFFYVLCYHIDRIQLDCNPHLKESNFGFPTSQISHVNIHPFFQHIQKSLQSVLQSTLNPLRVIPKDVTQQIVKALLYYGIVDCRKIIHDGLRIPVRNHRLSKFLQNAYFPFDPYVLRESRTFIEPLYSQWDAPTYNFPAEIENQLQLLLTRHSDSRNMMNNYTYSTSVYISGSTCQNSEEELPEGSFEDSQYGDHSSFSTFTDDIGDIMDENGEYTSDDDFDDDDEDDVFGVSKLSNF